MKKELRDIMHLPRSTVNYKPKDDEPGCKPSTDTMYLGDSIPNTNVVASINLPDNRWSI